MKTLLKQAKPNEGQSPAGGGGGGDLQGRPEEIVQGIVQKLSEAAPREWQRMMQKLRQSDPRVARVLKKLSGNNQPGGGGGGGQGMI